MVNNGGGGALDLAPLPYQNLTWIHIPRNIGPAAAFNRGIAESRDTPYVFLLNDDAEVEPECLALLVNALETDPSYSIPVLKLLQWSDPSRLDGAGDEVLLGGGAFRVGQGELDRGQHDRVKTVLSACGAAAMYGRAHLDDVGGFDEDFYAYREDIDPSLQALLRGYHCLFIPEARVRLRGSSTMGNPFHHEIIRLTTRDQISTIAKKYPHSLLLHLWPRALVDQILWIGFAIEKRAFAAACRGLIGARRLLPRTLGRRRQVISRRVVSNREMLRRVSESEKKIWKWHVHVRAGRPLKLLAAYFRACGRPRT